MVVQFDGGCPPPLETALTHPDGLEAADGTSDAAGAADADASLPGVRVLGLAKLKCLRYLVRTFGVRNQLGVLLDRGAAAYLAGTERFMRTWGVPTEHRERLGALFSGWTREVALLSEPERKALRGGQYLAYLEPYLDGRSPRFAEADFGLDRFLLLLANLTGEPLPSAMADYAPGMVPMSMHDSPHLARAGCVLRSRRGCSPRAARRPC